MYLTALATMQPLSTRQTQPEMRAHDFFCFHTMVGSLAGTRAMFLANGYGGTESTSGPAAAGSSSSGRTPAHGGRELPRQPHRDLSGERRPGARVHPVGHPGRGRGPRVHRRPSPDAHRVGDGGVPTGGPGRVVARRLPPRLGLLPRRHPPASWSRTPGPAGVGSRSTRRASRRTGWCPAGCSGRRRGGRCAPAPAHRPAAGDDRPHDLRAGRRGRPRPGPREATRRPRPAGREATRVPPARGALVRAGVPRPTEPLWVRGEGPPRHPHVAGADAAPQVGDHRHRAVHRTRLRRRRSVPTGEAPRRRRPSRRQNVGRVSWTAKVT
jgi:hypothetical protein